ncbi:hypothetical protein C8J56DRAFT_1105001 [Mycena floridula]|nr:hypothetical protein C8J56DRAFT_1105001 [Mycena floridula]
MSRADHQLGKMTSLRVKKLDLMYNLASIHCLVIGFDRGAAADGDLQRIICRAKQTLSQDFGAICHAVMSCTVAQIEMRSSKRQKRNIDMSYKMAASKKMKPVCQQLFDVRGLVLIDFERKVDRYSAKVASRLAAQFELQNRQQDKTDTHLIRNEMRRYVEFRKEDGAQRRRKDAQNHGGQNQIGHSSFAQPHLLPRKVI